MNHLPARRTIPCRNGSCKHASTSRHFSGHCCHHGRQATSPSPPHAATFQQPTSPIYSKPYTSNTPTHFLSIQIHTTQRPTPVSTHPTPHPSPNSPQSLRPGIRCLLLSLLLTLFACSPSPPSRDATLGASIGRAARASLSARLAASACRPRLRLSSDRRARGVSRLVIVRRAGWGVSGVGWVGLLLVGRGGAALKMCRRKRGMLGVWAGRRWCGDGCVGGNAGMGVRRKVGL